MSRKSAFTLVELLVVIAIIAVLLAILLPSLAGAKALAKRLQCQSREKGIASAVVLYAETYDGRMPAPDGGAAGHENSFVKAQWMLASVGSVGNITLPPKWRNMGCLFKAGLVQDGRLFYCLATEGWQDYYNLYSTPGPWGSNIELQPANNPPLAAAGANAWLRNQRGYSYWPLARFNYKDSDISALGDNIELRYAPGYPGSPLKSADLAPTKSMIFDFAIHQVKGSGYNINVTFGDTHVVLQKVPREATGLKRYRFPYQQDIMVPAEDRTNGLPDGPIDTNKWSLGSLGHTDGDRMWLYTQSLSQVN